MPEPDRLVEQLERYGQNPRTVFDIGVDTGTPWLYRAFPDAHFYLVDPTPTALEHMQRIAGEASAQVMNVAFGDTTSVLTFNLWPEHPSASSFFADEGAPDTVPVDVPVVRFDETVGAFARPALLKLDVQGAEMMVLRGLGERIREIDVIVVETSLLTTVRGGPEIAELTAFLCEHGFVLYDVVGLMRRPLDGALALIDAVYVPVDSPLRVDRRWAAG